MGTKMSSSLQRMGSNPCVSASAPNSQGGVLATPQATQECASTVTSMRHAFTGTLRRGDAKEYHMFHLNGDPWYHQWERLEGQLTSGKSPQPWRGSALWPALTYLCAPHSLIMLKTGPGQGPHEAMPRPGDTPLHTLESPVLRWNATSGHSEGDAAAHAFKSAQMCGQTHKRVWDALCNGSRSWMPAP